MLIACLITGVASLTGLLPYVGSMHGNAKRHTDAVPFAASMHGNAKRPPGLVLFAERMQTKPGGLGASTGQVPYTENTHGNAKRTPAFVPFAERMHGKAKRSPDLVPSAERMQTNLGGLGTSTRYVPYAETMHDNAKGLPALMPCAERMHGEAKRPELPFRFVALSQRPGAARETSFFLFPGRSVIQAESSKKYLLQSCLDVAWASVVVPKAGGVLRLLANEMIRTP